MPLRFSLNSVHYFPGPGDFDGCHGAHGHDLRVSHINEPPHGKTNNLLMRKQRRRSASR